MNDEFLFISYCLFLPAAYCTAHCACENGARLRALAAVQGSRIVENELTGGDDGLLSSLFRADY
jgi:hypothetical protein